MASYESVSRSAVASLMEKGVASAALDVSILMSHVTGKSRLELFTAGVDEMPEVEHLAFSALVERRLKGEPVAYITGEKEFWGLPFKVEEGVLIPRPDTETLVGALVAFVGDKKAEALVADIGTGSGALIVSILHEFKNFQGFGVDISPKALSVTAYNAEKNGVANRLSLLEGSYLEPLIEKGVQLDILVSNPPYIRTDVVGTLQKDVRDYEPHLALDGGRDGLVAYKSIIPQAEDVLKEGGLLMFEIGFDQKNDIMALFDAEKWSNMKCFKDLAGHDRVIVAIKKEING